MRVWQSRPVLERLGGAACGSRQRGTRWLGIRLQRWRRSENLLAVGLCHVGFFMPYLVARTGKTKKPCPCQLNCTRTHCEVSAEVKTKRTVAEDKTDLLRKLEIPRRIPAGGRSDKLVPPPLPVAAPRDARHFCQKPKQAR